jgi:hypothetical protein
MLDGTREDITEDFDSWTVLLQLTNRVAYQGYHFVTRIGAQLERQTFDQSPTQSASLFFLSMNAGLGE